MLWDRSLAYQAEALVNFDPVDRTVLANEQVDASGRSWRSGALVEKIKLRQWFFRITAFQESLLDNLDYLGAGGKWPERVISQQRNWLGRSVGAKIKFTVERFHGESEEVSIFTTRPDTLFGVTYLAVSPSHPLVSSCAEESVELQRFLAEQSSSTPDSQQGFQLPKISATNPIANIVNRPEERLPVFVASYVLDDYGEGAVMGVPAHDARDLAFWKQNRPLSRVPIVVSSDVNPKNLEPRAADVPLARTERGLLTSLCGPYSGLSSDNAARTIIAQLRESGRAEVAESWRLRDWLVSRQRYWGTPIPMIHCKQCGIVPVPDDQLPVELPKLDLSFRGMRGNPLDKIEKWVNIPCPSCSGPAKRDTDTMDTFVDSSWYFLRFLDVHNQSEPFDGSVFDSGPPVDTYVGGSEHAILHLLYARFIYKFLADEEFAGRRPVGPGHVQEPFHQLISQGMVHGKTYSDPVTGRFLLPNEITHTDGVAVIKASGITPNVTWEKMSKSKHNGVDPATCIDKYGADATRAHILFSAPIGEILQWDDEKIVGIQRWFQRISRLVAQFQESHTPQSQEALGPLVAQARPNLEHFDTNNAQAFLLTQKTIKSVTHTFEHDLYGLNTTVSDLIKLTNGLLSCDMHKLTFWVAYNSLATLLRLLAPIAPAFAEQLWEDLHARVGGPDDITSIFGAGWPKIVLEDRLEALYKGRMETTKCAVQINGKLRFTAEVPALGLEEANQEERERTLVETILSTSEGKYWLQEKNEWEARKRVVVVGGGKLVNVVF